MGSSNPRLSVPRDPPVWCEAETGSAVNITPELPAEQEETLSKHGRRRAVINPHPRMVGRSGRLGAATRVVPQRFVFRLCLLVRQRRFFTGEKSLIFLPKGLQTAARIILPQAAKFHTGSLRGIFPHAHVAVKNDPNFSRLRTRTLRGFLAPIETENSRKRIPGVFLKIFPVPVRNTPRSCL